MDGRCVSVCVVWVMGLDEVRRWRCGYGVGG